MEYNSIRESLILPEYGRNIQNMVKHAMTIDDRDNRNDAARAIVEVIGNLVPHLRDNPDYRHKLWDHLFIMSDFKLDVDSPYGKPEPETFSKPPERVAYPVKSRKYRHYGQLVLKMIEVASRMEPGDERTRAELAIANHMKKTYLLWNKDHVDDEVIFNDLSDLSNGQIELSEQTLISKKSVSGLSQSNKPTQKRGKRHFKNYKKKRYNNNNNNNKGNRQK